MTHFSYFVFGFITGSLLVYSKYKNKYNIDKNKYNIDKNIDNDCPICKLKGVSKEIINTRCPRCQQVMSIKKSESSDFSCYCGQKLKLPIWA